LFVFLIQNYGGLSAWRLNTEEYSAYPHEEEYLLKEAFQFDVLRIDEDMEIGKVAQEFEDDYRGKKISIIYCYNYSRAENEEKEVKKNYSNN